ncbi:MAG TPA: DinB family protein, partial [Vicinamibacterales bacterium]
MSMMISQSMLPEFDHEMSNLRKTLERVPEGKPDFRPHAKSMTLCQLAGHLAEIPTWAAMTNMHDEFDVSPVSGPKYQPYLMTTRAELLAKFDADLKQARESLAATTDDRMMATWTLKSGGQT